MREILQIDIRGTRLVGTYHISTDGSVSRVQGRSSVTEVGVLLLNVGQLPRAGLGDMPVELADRLCERGYPTFRFDLPGLGDSQGDLSATVVEEWRLVQDGKYAVWASELTTELKQRFRLQGLILGGLCGGAINAVYAAEECCGDAVGLILLEPNLFLLGIPDAQVAEDASPLARLYAQQAIRIKRSLRRIRSWLTESAIGGPVRSTYSLVRRVRAKILGPSLPRDANVRLIDGCRRLAEVGMPMLFVTAGNAHRDLIRQGVFGRGPSERVTFVEVNGTNHMLVAGGGKPQVIGHVERWVLNELFPPAGDTQRR
jgi:pimeloyl-ACP methyl ester carboxylesterase